MEEACGALEREFKRINNDLEYVNHRLDSDFRSSTDDELNVMNIFKRMQAVEAKLVKLNSKAKYFCQERDNFLSLNVLASLDASELSLSNAMYYSGCSNDIPKEVFARVGGRLVVEIEKENMENIEVVPELSIVEKSEKKELKIEATTKAPATAFLKPSSKGSSKSTKTDKKVVISEEECVVVPSDMTPKDPLSETYFTPEEFSSLPETVRGRCKYSDTYLVYSRIIQFACDSVVPGMVSASGSSRRRASMSSSTATTTGSRRSTRKSISTTGHPPSIPAMTFSTKELSNAITTTTSSSSSSDNNKLPQGFTLTGRTGYNMLLSLRSLGLLTIANNTVTLTLTPRLEHEIQTQCTQQR